MTNNNEFFGLKVNPVDLFATVFSDALGHQADAAKNKVRDFDPQAHFENIFAAGQGFFEGLNIPGAPEQKKTEVTPAVDVLESETGVTYLVGAPGVQPEEVSVELEDTKLTIGIQARSIFSSPETTRNWKGGSWSQSFSVPTGDAESPKHIDEESIVAKVENGLITVRVSYKAPKVTKIKVG